MSFRTASSRRAFGLILGLLLIAGVASAYWHGRNEFSDFHRFSISLGGGYGFSEGHQGMLDLKTELQFGLTSRIRLGLGIGYLNGEGRHGFYGEWKDGREEMMAGLPEQSISEERKDQDGQWRGYRRDFQLLPLSLNVYYDLPLGRRWDIFVNGGGSYYFGSFHGMGERQHKNAWGGQGGLGVEFRLARQIQLVAEGSYRFAEFRGLNKMVPVDSTASADSTSDIDMVKERRDYSHMDLNGFGLRLGVKLGF
jgi:hypothetical protein